MQAMRLLLQLTALYLLAMGSVAAQQECMRTMGQHKKDCFHDRNLDLTFMPNNIDVLNPQYESYETLFTILDPEIFCDNLEAYREATVCMNNVTRECYDPDGSQGMLPSDDRIYLGMQTLCGHRDDVDARCFKTFFNTAADCATYNQPRLGLSAFSSTIQELTCGVTEMQYDCMEIVLTPLCGVNTTVVYLEQVGLYQVAPMCLNGSEPTRERPRWFESLNAAAASNNDVDSGATTTTGVTTTVTAITAVATAALLLLRMP